MAEQKTKVNDQNVEEFLNQIGDPARRADCFTLSRWFEKVTGYPPRMWGDSIVGFGKYHYKYASGHEGDAALTGFSPRKQNLTIYVTTGFDHFTPDLAKLGKFTHSKSCLYVKSLGDIDLSILEKIISQSVKKMKETYPHTD